jgi:hypothetical protein
MSVSALTVFVLLWRNNFRLEARTWVTCGKKYLSALAVLVPLWQNKSL